MPLFRCTRDNSYDGVQAYRSGRLYTFPSNPNTNFFEAYTSGDDVAVDDTPLPAWLDQEGDWHVDKDLQFESAIDFENDVGVTGTTSLSDVDIDGFLKLPTVAKSADYTVLDDDGVLTILVTAGASGVTITLPTAADNAGRILEVKKVDSGVGAVTIAGEGAETIDGTNTVFWTQQYQSLTLQCDGTEWFII